MINCSIMQPTPQQAIAATRGWVDKAVIALTLCPWAAQADLRYVHTHAQDARALKLDLQREIDALLRPTTPRDATTLLVHPQAMITFDEYYPFLAEFEQHLRYANLSEQVMVVGFHPDFLFGGEEPEDASHYTNRSPWPTTHILRQESVTRAVEAHGDSLSIPVVNQGTLRRLGRQHMQSLLDECGGPVLRR